MGHCEAPYCLGHTYELLMNGSAENIFSKVLTMEGCPIFNEWEHKLFLL